MKKIVIYTDGSCINNPGKGGWATQFLLYKNNKLTYSKLISGCSKHSTNNIMELTAVIEALKQLKPNAKNYTIEIFSDSEYVINGLTKYRDSWEYRNFKGVKNSELWKKLFDLYDNYKNITIKHVRAHNGDKYNEIVDKEAKKAAINCK